MERHERLQLRTIIDEVGLWSQQARVIQAERAQIEQAAADAVSALTRGAVDVGRDGTVAWRVMPLRIDDGARLYDIARAARLPTVSPGEAQVLAQLASEVTAAAHDASSSVGARRLLAGSRKKDAGRSAGEFLSTYRSWGVANRLTELLARLRPVPDPDERYVQATDALAEWVGLAPRVLAVGQDPKLLAASALAGLPSSVSAIERALREEGRFRAEAVKAGNEVRRCETRKLLADMPAERLKDATRDRLRIGPLIDAGIDTVLLVLESGPILDGLPGIGATTATRMRGAALTLWQTTYDEMPTRIDIKNRSAEATELLRRLAAWDATRRTKNATADVARAAELTALSRVLDSEVSHVIVLTASTLSISELDEAVETVLRRAQQISTNVASDPWSDFPARPADYFAMLSELGFILEDEQKTHGDLPDDIVEAVRSLELNTENLSASLRGYQSFGARFALVQRKVIIGDEMGLGKTVEALAVLAHLRSKGAHHSLVICPAAVVTNWVREVESKSTLRAHRLHGPGRDAAATNWARNGGVAITTFESLAWFSDRVSAPRDLGCVIVDEAHYIKNLAALRSRRATQVLDSCDRAIFLTGTPLENRIQEFANLIGYLRPDLVIDADVLAPRRFRRQVAPAYLRRNQEDVLTELPELVEVNEWLPLSREDAAAYRSAVAAGNFMAMRQAALSQGNKSQKLLRLIELVGEAEANGRRVIVFSHFRGVLDQVARALPGKVFGPLTGSVPAAARQVLVDEFSAAGHGAVLVAQIVAGGVGLNIQAASVVVICEPQLKPTTEWQAIARARRMGQLETVQVHRLLSEEGVDLRITEILARKREVFDDFARISETAESAPEALDVSEADLARDVIAAERERLFSEAVPSE